MIEIVADFYLLAAHWPVYWAVLIGISVLLLAGSYFVSRRPKKENGLESAQRLFESQQEVLQSQFFQIASTSGKPRGLIWTKTEWKRDIAYARDLNSSLLTAFVGVEISFEAIPGGEMEEVEAVGQIRQASALFHFRNGHWGTGGKAFFNMTPAEAVQRLDGQFEPL